MSINYAGFYHTRTAAKLGADRVENFSGSTPIRIPLKVGSDVAGNVSALRYTVRTAQLGMSPVSKNFSAIKAVITGGENNNNPVISYSGQLFP
jgi:hypothetical protein